MIRDSGSGSGFRYVAACRALRLLAGVDRPVRLLLKAAAVDPFTDDTRTHNDLADRARHMVPVGVDRQSFLQFPGEHLVAAGRLGFQFVDHRVKRVEVIAHQAFPRGVYDVLPFVLEMQAIELLFEPRPIALGKAGLVALDPPDGKLPAVILQGGRIKWSGHLRSQ